MIEFILNGEIQRREAAVSVAALLEEMALAGKRLAVEMDGRIVPKSQHDRTLVDAGSQLEIVVAVGGG
ncbi:Thiamine biosynthesis protein ThiS [Sterolibacterium denitrificans]|uniref:Thiamine biosynthesis protein ThiS n=2 Tax=Sterolibacterium denitrificans TaxID=157592 RepID=A0A656Z9P6_9PROT|nr:sulfur carrier protein ThiS [Sterolibacterium denitrificans]KYC29036.1 thiamine biosynthesis protein ThiS [Sterolibacterium denitrificans]SMB21263.1 Thiamine biosynthesis protein ThiS [Sterolibacterium denitrificans]